MFAVCLVSSALCCPAHLPPGGPRRAGARQNQRGHRRVTHPTRWPGEGGPGPARRAAFPGEVPALGRGGQRRLSSSASPHPRPFLGLQFCCTFPTWLFPFLSQFYFKTSSAVFFFTTGAINILATAAPVLHGCREVASAGCVGGAGAAGRGTAVQAPDLAAPMQTRGQERDAPGGAVREAGGRQTRKQRSRCLCQVKEMKGFLLPAKLFSACRPRTRAVTTS